MRSIVVAVMFATVVAAASAQKAPEPARAAARPHPADGFDTIVQPFLSQNCFTCHGNKKQENGLNLQSFEIARLAPRASATSGTRSSASCAASEMPPIEEEQPPKSRRQAVATWLARELERIDRVTPPDPGRVTARRLNRTEYNNTIRELLGVDAAARRRLPAGRCRATASTTSPTCCRSRRC